VLIVIKGIDQPHGVLSPCAVTGDTGVSPELLALGAGAVRGAK